jgi:hypothetical protein
MRAGGRSEHGRTVSHRTVVVTVTGEMDQRLREAFADVDVTSARGITQLRFVRRDASVLHGVLARVEALGLQVLDVHSADADEPVVRSPDQR